MGRSDDVLEGRDAVGVGRAFEVDVDLGRERDAMQDAPIGLLAIQRRCPLQSLLAQVIDHGVQHGVGLVHTLHRRLNGFPATQLARTDLGSGFSGGQFPDFSHGFGLPLLWGTGKHS